MKTTVRIALLLSLTIATACRFVADKKDDVALFLASSVLGSVAELQSETPLEQSSFRNTEPVAPKKEAKKPAVTAPTKIEKPVTLVAERRAVRASRHAFRIVRVKTTGAVAASVPHRCAAAIVVVPVKADETFGS